MNGIVYRLARHYAEIQRYQSALALLLSNLVPLIGVLFFGWSGFNIVFLYWSENVIIGFFNVLKMLVAGAAGDPSAARTALQPLPGRPGQLVFTVFLTGFFTFHYGLFTFVHGVFVVALFKFVPSSQGGGPPAQNPFNLFEQAREALASGLGVAFLVLFLSHGFSFFVNFLYRGEYKRVSVPALFVAPYGRIVVLHLAILAGAFVGIAVGFPTAIVAMLVLMKTGLDLGFHLLERRTGAIVPFRAP
jgi:hypothetical protein